MAALVAIGAVVLALLAVLRRSWWFTAVTLVLVAGLAVGALQHHRLVTGPIAELADAQAMAGLDLVVRSDPQRHAAVGPRPAYATLRADLVRIDARASAWRVRTPVLLIVSGSRAQEWSTAVVGSRITTTGRLQPPESGSDLAAVVQVRAAMTQRGPPSPGLRLVERVRAGLRRSVEGRREEPRALVPALVLGDTSAMAPEITGDFQKTGLTHLTAVSGANLTLLLAFLLLIARWVGVRGRWLRLVGLVGVLVFVALCRTEPSVLRAAAMGLVALAALGAGGRQQGLRTLAVAMVALLLIDPFLSRSLGFVLSVLASAGIVWWARRWSTILHAWLPRIVAESVAVPLAAHLATLPVVAGISAQVSVVGVVTNALAGPCVGPATVLGFAAAGLSLVSTGAAACAAFGAAWSAQVILWVAHAGAGFPGASWHWPATPGSLLVLSAVSLALAKAMPHVLSRRWLSVVLAVLAVAGFVRAPIQPGWPPKAWVFVTCDVGQGDGLVLRAGPDEAVVIDGGPDPAPMGRCLDELGIRRVPVLLFSHFHSDHIAGMPAVFAHRSVGEVWVCPFASPPAGVDQVRAEAARRRVAVRVPAVGETGQVGEVSWRVLGPVLEHRAVPGDAQSAEENDASLVLMATVRGVRILLTGDVEPPGQQAILADGADLRADVLKIPHHGSGHQEPGFLAATHARIAIASDGINNDYGHPSPRTVRLVQSLGMTMLRTDLDGSVAVVSDRGQMSAVTQHRR